jgi:hypothetical protein
MAFADADLPHGAPLPRGACRCRERAPVRFEPRMSCLATRHHQIMPRSGVDHPGRTRKPPGTSWARGVRPPGRHERAPLPAELLPPAHAQCGQALRQDIALLVREVLGADRNDGPDRSGPQSRTEVGSRRRGAH